MLQKNIIRSRWVLCVGLLVEQRRCLRITVPSSLTGLNPSHYPPPPPPFRGELRTPLAQLRPGKPTPAPT